MATKSDLLVGCCGFPAALERYTSDFSLVEVQQTFYQPPRLSTLTRWRRQVPPGFEFAIKAWQLITHEASSPTYRRLDEKLSDRQRRETGGFRLNATVMSAWRRTLECARALSCRVVLFQCPARFAPTRVNKKTLRAFIREIGRDASLITEALTFVWEPRGEWKSQEVRELCEELGLVHGVDPFHARPTTDHLGYFRLHGRTGYRYRYTPSDLKELLSMAQDHLPCYVLFNNWTMLDDAKNFQRLALTRWLPRSHTGCQ